MRSPGLSIEATCGMLKSWKRKAAASGMTLTSWVRHTLNSAPVLVVSVAPKGRERPGGK